MNFLLWIFFGAITGWIAQMVIGKKSFGCISNVIIGIAGAIIGGLLFEYFGGSGITGFNIYSFFVSTVGSIVLLALINLAKSK